VDIKGTECADVVWIHLAEAGISDGLLWTRSRTFEFHKCGDFLDQLTDYQLLRIWLCSMDLVHMTQQNISC